MKLLVILVLVAVALARPEDAHYDPKFDSFDIDEIIENPRLMKAYAHCYLGDGKCTSQAKDIKGLIPEATKTSCAKCTEKQKVLIAKYIKALQEKLPEEYQALKKKVDPEGQFTESVKKYLQKYAP